MSAKPDNPGAGALDTIKVVVAVAILLGGVVGYYQYPDASVLIRAAGVVVAIAAAIAVFMTSVQGQELWRFIQSSRVELRKVVWPTGKDTRMMTIYVLIFTFVMALFFWLLDSLLGWLTRILTGQGG